RGPAAARALRGDRVGRGRVRGGMAERARSAGAGADVAQRCYSQGAVSRAIVVRVAESVVRIIHVEDGVESPLEMLPILARERMGELLAAELVALGFVRDGNTCKRTEPDGVAVKLGAGAKIEEELAMSARADEDYRERAESALREHVVQELDARVAAQAE